MIWFKLLKFICPAALYEAIEGDLIQKYNKDIRLYGVRKAKQRLAWNTIRFFRPGIMLRNKFSFHLNHAYMIRTYIVMAMRSLRRRKVFSVVNMLGLSVSMVACLLILQYVRFELSYDKFHDHAENIYRVATRVTLQHEVVTHEANTYEGISSALKSGFPEVVTATTVGRFDSDDVFIRYEQSNDVLAPLPSFQGLRVDSNFFEVFSFPLLEGNSRVVLRLANSALVTKRIADMYFSGKAVGKVIEANDGNERTRYIITGVLKDVPANSHMTFDLLVSPSNPERNFLNRDNSFWDWTGQTYILLSDNVLPSSLVSKLNQLAAASKGLKRNKNDYDQRSTFELQPLGDIHLFSHLQEELTPNGSSTVVYVMAVLALIIMIIAWVNYMNLSTTLAEEKMKAIGIRKVIGASIAALVFQVLTESAVFNFLSMIGAGVLVHLLLPAFSDFSGIPLDYARLYDLWTFVFLISFVVVSTLMSGLYPAFAIASFYPIRALKGKTDPRNGFDMRKVLVVLQFSAAVFVVVTTLIAYAQLSFMRTRELGIAIDQTLIVKALNFDKETWSDAAGGYVIDSAYINKARLFEDDLRSQASFANATSLSHLPGQLPNWGTEFKAESVDPQKAHRLVAMGIDDHFLSAFHVKLLAGRNFSPDYPADRGNEGRRAVLINEAASALLGFRTPDEAVNKHITTYWGVDYEIIGVVNSFHQLSLKENLQPIYFILQPRALAYFAIRYNGQHATDAIQQIETSWHRYFPDRPFNYFFLDQYYDRQYHYDQKFSELMQGFSGLAIFVACLGLFGLTSYAIVKRTKEIGIRKVLGASATQIVNLFTRDFVKLILVANVIAIPLMYIGASRWLDNYAYRIELSGWFFAVPLFLMISLALATVALQTIHVAQKNPVDSLKHE